MCKKDVRLLPLGILKTFQKWIKDFNGDAKTIKLLEENIAINPHDAKTIKLIGKKNIAINPHDLRSGNNFLYVTQKS